MILIITLYLWVIQVVGKSIKYIIIIIVYDLLHYYSVSTSQQQCLTTDAKIGQSGVNYGYNIV